MSVTSEPLPVAFVAGFDGRWMVEGISAPVGDPLPPAARLAVVEGADAEVADGRWVLRGVVSGQGEDARTDQLPLGRPEARCAVLLAVRMTPDWWERAEEDRRALSATIEHGPAISRRIHRALDRKEPFDVLTWFEFPPNQHAEVNDMLTGLRGSQEWPFVERAVQIHLIR